MATHVDASAALILAAAAGVPNNIAAPLVMAVQSGQSAGAAKLKEGAG